MFADSPLNPVVPQTHIMGMPNPPTGMFQPQPGMHAAAANASVPPWMMNTQRMPTRAPAPMAAPGQGGMRPPAPMYGAPRAPSHNPIPAFNSKIGY